jgi:hypothetical protein
MPTSVETVFRFRRACAASPITPAVNNAATAQRDVLIGAGPANLQCLAVELPSEVVKLEKAR